MEKLIEIVSAAINSGLSIELIRYALIAEGHTEDTIKFVISASKRVSSALAEHL
jgi:hypothetical protein